MYIPGILEKIKMNLKFYQPITSDVSFYWSYIANERLLQSFIFYTLKRIAVILSMLYKCNICTFNFCVYVLFNFIMCSIKRL